MKVLSQPDYTDWTYRFTCPTCKAELQADHTDLKYCVVRQWVENPGDSGFSYDTDYFYVICPICLKPSQFDPSHKGDGASYLLQEKLKKEYHEGLKKGK